MKACEDDGVILLEARNDEGEKFGFLGFSEGFVGDQLAVVGIEDLGGHQDFLLVGDALVEAQSGWAGQMVREVEEGSKS